MKLLLLSRAESVASTRLLVRAAEARGMQVQVFNPSGVPLVLGAQNKLPAADVVVPRLADTAGEQAFLVAQAVESRCGQALNSVAALLRARVRARWLQRLAGAGVAVPRSVIVRAGLEGRLALKSVGGAPVRVLALTPGAEVAPVVCESARTLEPVVEAITGLGHSVLIQEHLRPSARVARVCVVGDACVGFSRVAEGLGPRLAALKQAAAQLAVLAAKTAELEVAEVDVALKNDALLVTELRACPPLTKAAAEAVVALAEQRAALRA